MRRDAVVAFLGMLLLAGCAPAIHSSRPLEGRADAIVGPGSVDAVIDEARGLLGVAERGKEASARRSAAERAVGILEGCRSIDSLRPDCDYWLGLALGLLAREKPTTASSALPRMIEKLSRAARESPRIDRAGPDRALALIFVRAPGWPLGPGDPDRGLEHAERAVALDGGHAPNRLALAEALAGTGDGPGAEAARLEALEWALAAEAAGERDAEEWVREARQALDRR